MASGKATPINEALSDAKRGNLESQPLLEDSTEHQTYEATEDAVRDADQTKDTRADDSRDDEQFQVQIKKAESRYLTVELPVAMTTLVFQMLNTFETEYIHERISADYNVSQSDNFSACYNNSDTVVSAQIQSEVSTWLFYLGLAYAVPSEYL